MIVRAIFPNRVYADLVFDVTLLCVFTYAMVTKHFLWYTWIFVGLILVRLYFDLMEYFIFQRPEKFRKETLQIKGWKDHTRIVKGYNIHYHLYHGRKDKPLIVFLHGWRSSSGRMKNRIQQFVNLDWSICAIDLPNHGSSDAVKKWSAEFSSTCIIEILNGLDYSNTNQKLIIYGHSIGGFIALRLCKRMMEWEKTVNLQALILESPMTKYSYILQRAYRALKVPQVLRSLMDRRIFFTVNRLTTISSDFSSIHDADIPRWGMPTCSLMILQAGTDTQLGRSHYEDFLFELTASSTEFESHLIDSLSHSGGDQNQERSILIERFLKKQNLY